MSLLTIISDASALCGLGTVSAVYTSTDLNVQQMMGLAQQEGDELCRFHDWRALKTAKTFTGTGATTYALPTDFDRLITGDALWLADSPLIALDGPVSDADMLAFKAASSTPSRPIWRLFGSSVEFYPALDTGEAANTEYLSSQWISSQDGLTNRTRWAADSDTARISERVITLGVVWRWKKAKGFDYAEDFRTHQVERLRAAAKDGGQRVIQLNETTARSRRSDVKVIP